jgi:nicotinamidase-related amidase
MKTIEIEDHQTALKALNEHLQIDPKKTAVVTVDMHRGHLDPVEATLPAPFEESKRVCQHSHDLLTFARAKGIPVIHVIAVFREEEADKISPMIAAARVVLSKAAPKTEAQRRGGAII